MTKVLTIDCGNTATKVVAWDGDHPGASASFPRGNYDSLQKLLAETNASKAAICSVVDDGSIAAAICAEAGISPLIVNHLTPMPITLGYATPATLGADRIAAAVGAFSLAKGVTTLIVDIGTAVTYDLVSADGHFAGGNIAPGIGMRLKALHEFTASLPAVDSHGDTPLWGHSTETAMRSGAVNGVAAEIAFYRSQLPSESLVILTGGWSADLARLLPFQTTVCPNLIPLGLHRILSYNENI